MNKFYNECARCNEPIEVNEKYCIDCNSQDESTDLDLDEATLKYLHKSNALRTNK